MFSLKHLAASAFCAIVLAGCESPVPTQPAVRPVASVGNGAFTSTSSQTEPVSGTLDNPCTGEPLVFSGAFHTIFHITANANGFHIVTEGNASGIKAVGLISGAKYIGTQADHDSFNATVGVEETVTNSFKAIGQGSVANLNVHSVLHITVNANGEVTSFVDNLSVTCK